MASYRVYDVTPLPVTCLRMRVHPLVTISGDAGYKRGRRHGNSICSLMVDTVSTISLFYSGTSYSGMVTLQSLLDPVVNSLKLKDLAVTIPDRTYGSRTFLVFKLPRKVGRIPGNT